MVRVITNIRNPGNTELEQCRFFNISRIKLMVIVEYKKFGGVIMKIRLIQAKDNAPLANIIRTNLKQFDLDKPETAYYDPELDHLSQFYQQTPFRDYYVVEENDEILGGAGFAEYEPEKKIAELQKVYLSDKAKGKRLSYQLIKKVEGQARRAGYTSLYLETHTNLKVAMHVYENLGFKLLNAPLKVGQHTTMNRFYIKPLDQ